MTAVEIGVGGGRRKRGKERKWGCLFENESK